MSLIKGLQTRPLMAIATVLASIVLGIAVWQASRLPVTASSEDRQQLQKQLRNGVGSEVRFASRPEQAHEAVALAADFIQWRSGLKVSDETRKRLARAESDVLNGKSSHITVTELIDDMTTAVVDRLATLTDEEIADGDGLYDDEDCAPFDPYNANCVETCGGTGNEPLTICGPG